MSSKRKSQSEFSTCAQMVTRRASEGWQHVACQQGSSRTCRGGKGFKTASISIVLLLCLTGSPCKLLAASITDATALYHAGQYEACLNQTEEEVGRGIYNQNWWLLQIDCQLATGKLDAALATLESGLAKFQYSIELRLKGIDVCRRNGLADRAITMAEDLEELATRIPWRYSDASSRITLGRHFLAKHADAREVLEKFFDAAKKRNPSEPESYIATAELALSKNDYGMAVAELQKAAKLENANPQVHFLLAKALSASDARAATAELALALELNPKHESSLLLRADQLIDREQYAEAELKLNHVLENNPESAKAWAYLSIIAYLRNDKPFQQLCYEMATSWWNADPEIEHLLGRKLSAKYRFAEGAAHQRRALDYDPTFTPAKLQLAQDLLRLGEEQEGWRLAQLASQEDAYNVVANNLVNLHQNIEKFETIERDGFVLRMDAVEAKVYGKRALDLLVDAKSVLTTKYDVKLRQPIIVEIFPKQADFAIRTFGLPGGDGFLGVCFGSVITMNSPASQSRSPSNWEAVLWHEFCHVVTLQKTNNKMPRWLSEGISVYEELQRNQAWGQRMTPTYREMILGDALTPVSQLSSAFLNPPSPAHLQFAYFESALVVDYLVDQFGIETLNKVLADLAVGMPVNESLERYTVSMKKLDADFAAHAKQLANDMAPEADWEQLPEGVAADAQQLNEFLAKHPNSFYGVQARATKLVRQQKWALAMDAIEHLRKIYPDYVGPNNAAQLAAVVHKAKSETDKEQVALEWLAKTKADDLETYQRLMEIYAEKHSWPELLGIANQAAAVNPLLASVHEAKVKAARELDKPTEAIAAYRSMLALGPMDVAETHFQLASLLHHQKQLEDSKRHTLLAIEEAPRFRAAHWLLLSLHAANEKEDPTEKASDVVTPQAKVVGPSKPKSEVTE